MEIKILGTGCPKCKTLEKVVNQIVSAEHIDAEVLLEQDIVTIMSYGVLRTPGLVIDGNLVLSGRVPSEKELKDLLQH